MVSISGRKTESLIILKSGTYTVERNATIIPGGDLDAFPGYAIKDDFMGSPVANVRLNVDGRLMGAQGGIVLGGANDVVTIGKTAEISGLLGVGLTGDNSKVVNNSYMSAASLYGLLAQTGDHITLQNNGTIVSDVGMFVALGATNSVMVNSKGASIIGMEGAIVVGSAAGEATKIINHGSLSVTYKHVTAITGGDGDETLINDGTITYGIELGGGNDTIDTRGGTIKGPISTAGGDDMLITDSAKYKIFEFDGGGNDTVKSTVSYVLSGSIENLVLLGSKDINGTASVVGSALTGNSGDNVLKGLAGADTLFGGKGSDKLYGGDGADTFHFSTGDGKDRIMDFVSADNDIVDLSGWGEITAANISQHIDDVTGGILITFGKDSLFVSGMTVGTLDTADFSFA